MKKVECYDISQRSDVFREYKGTPTLCARMGTGGNNVPIVLMDQGGDCMSIKRLAREEKTKSLILPSKEIKEFN